MGCLFVVEGKVLFFSLVLLIIMFLDLGGNIKWLIRGIIMNMIVNNSKLNLLKIVFLVLIMLICVFEKWFGVVIVKGIEFVKLLCYIIKFEYVFVINNW